MTKHLLFSYLALIILTVTLLAVIVYLVTIQTFSRYISDQSNIHTEMLPGMLIGYYAVNGGWDDVQADIDEASIMINSPIVLANAEGQIVASSHLDLLGHGETEFFHLEQAIPIKDVQGILIGTLHVGRNPTQQRADEAFLVNVTRAQILAGVAVSLVALGLGVFLARSISRPLKEMSRAAAEIAQGNYATRVSLQGQDEVVALAQSFNLMAESISNHEQLRRDLVANISHDLRTPLTVIRGYLEGLRLGQIADRRSAEIAFDAMHVEVGHLLGLVDSLNQLATAEAGMLTLNCDSVSPTLLVKNVLARVALLADAKGIKLQGITAPPLPDVNVDSERIEQALFNLLENAIRHTPAGGAITLHALQEGAYLQLVVQDTGEGIPPEHLPYIFERFYRVDSARSQAEGGAGLGLAIVHAIIAAHSGRVDGESDGELGKGSTFVIYLPL